MAKKCERVNSNAADLPSPFWHAADLRFQYRPQGVGNDHAQVIEELIAMAKQFQEEMAREAALGLNTDEIAFYDALTNNESAVRELGDAILKKIAVEITEKRASPPPSTGRCAKACGPSCAFSCAVRCCVIKYPPDQAPEAVELVLKQAEVLSSGWAV